MLFPCEISIFKKNKSFCFIEISYYQSNFSQNQALNPYGNQSGSGQTISIFTLNIYIPNNNTVDEVTFYENQTATFLNGSDNSKKVIPVSLANARTLFVTHNRNLSITYDLHTTYVNTSVSLSIYKLCKSLFIDGNYNIYCSMNNPDQIMKSSSTSSTHNDIIIAGNGSTGSTADMLSSPTGIFVDNSTNLYVADSGNNRIQFFVPGQMNGITVIGSESTSSFTLDYPTSVVLDGNGYLFIVDNNDNRIVIFKSNEFQCETRYLDTDRLFLPNFMQFDSYQNIFVSDWDNSRIEESMLTINLCGKF
jgi:hypothetical protein